MSKPLDIPKIRERIGDKHREVMSNIEVHLEQVKATKRLRLVQVCSKIRAILQCFIDEGIIDSADEVEDRNYNTLAFNDHDEVTTYCLAKTDILRKLFVETDGNTMCLSASGRLNNGFDGYQMPLRVNEVDDYDWDKFVDSMMGFIHEEMYNTKEAYEAHFAGVLDGPDTENIQRVAKGTLPKQKAVRDEDLPLPSPEVKDNISIKRSLEK